MAKWFVVVAIGLVACASADDTGTVPDIAPNGMAGIGGAGGASGTAGVGGMSVGGSGSGGMMIAAGHGGAAGASAGAGGMSGGAGGSGAVGGMDGDGGVADGAACSDQTLLDVPSDLRERGPWDVGVRTVDIGRLKVEVVYPAAPGTTARLPVATYDVRDWLPEQERSKVPDANVPAVTAIDGKLYRDVPIDTEHGPYPLVVMIHGTSSFRIASGSITAHWASRGFVVVAADFPGLGLHDQLAATLECGYPQSGEQDIEGDVKAQIAAMQAPSGQLEFLGDRVDTMRIAIAGHSQGACNAAVLASLPNVQVVLPFTGSTAVSPSPSLKSIMYIAGMDDTVISYDGIGIGNVVCPPNPGPALSNMVAYLESPGQPSVVKRIVGIRGGGHLVPTDLCQTNAQGRNAIEESNMSGVCGINSAVIIGLPALFDCGTIDMERGLRAVSYASTAALEETLHCRDRSEAFANMQMMVPDIGDFQHEP